MNKVARGMAFQTLCFMSLKEIEAVRQLNCPVVWKQSKGGVVLVTETQPFGRPCSLSKKVFPAAPCRKNSVMPRSSACTEPAIREYMCIYMDDFRGSSGISLFAFS